MADDPEEEPETFIQKAVKIGLIAIPIMCYISWAHKKFVPCPKVYCHQANHPGSTVRNKSKKNECQKSRPKQERNVDECKKSKSPSIKREPSRHEYIGYLKRSAKQCCKKLQNPGKRCSNSSKTEEAPCSQKQQQSQKTNNSCYTQQKREPAADTCSQSNSEPISPEAFDKLFEQHFQKCVDEFKQHQKRMEEEIKRLREECEGEETKLEKPSDDEKGKYLECLADLNLDKDFECGQSFYSKDSDTPYVVKDYKCKTTREDMRKSQTNGASYLQCLTDLNLDKNFEAVETKTYSEGDNDCCPKRTQEKLDECNKNDSYSKTKQESLSRTKKEDQCDWETQEICEDETASERRSPKNEGGVSNIYTKAKLDECECDPHSNTMDTKNCGTSKGDPCAKRSMKDESDDTALKNFWHACGPPQGLRTGCRDAGCQNSTNKQH